MSDLSEKYIEKEKKLKKRKERILENDEYMNWLEKYTESKHKFTYDDSRDENVESLEALYLVIEEYAEENYVFPNIGYMAGQEVFFYCERTNDDNILDFEDILEGKKNPRAELIKLKLKELNLIINELSLTFPEEKIKREVSKVYQKRKNLKG